MSDEKVYDSSSITVLKGLDPVKKRPGMYTDTTNPNHLVCEIVDNSVDEAMAGHCNQINVTLNADGSVTVKDNGRGVPVDMHEEEQRPAAEVIFSVLHAGGKFEHDAYDFSGGLHGVGSSVVNALSIFFKVKIKRDLKEHEMTFEDGYLTSPLTVTNEFKRNMTGTEITFLPDPKYFDDKINISTLKDFIRRKAILCAGVTFTFQDKSGGNDEEPTVWMYEDGLDSFFSESFEPEDLLLESHIRIENTSEEFEMSLICNWNEGGSHKVRESFVNLIPTALGGTHVQGLRNGLSDSIREYCNNLSLLPRNVKLAPDDIFSDTSFVLSIKMREVSFEGQTKGKLKSSEAVKLVSQAVKNHMELYLNSDTENAKLICDKVIANAQERLKQDNKAAVKRKRTKIVMPGKLADCVSTDINENEIFFVEGDSAGGSAKQARDREVQAIMPLKGKINNTWDMASNTIASLQDINDIMSCLGVDADSSDLSELRYGKICILADADHDGFHIATLMTGLFYRHFYKLIEEGRVYIALPPLYRIDHGKEVIYALDEDERAFIVNKIRAKSPNANVQVTRFKGLGEMNPSQLKETTMNPSTRKMIRLVADPATREECTDMFNTLLAKKAANKRKALIEAHGVFDVK
ncbi:DNA topoisomerase IV subunit B [Aeromonas caviae]|uniref:DNA topoisomerase IV subunit B n=1 Tax=Aeromonas caviae TaxID=648 RepID=UPI00385F742D